MTGLPFFVFLLLIAAAYFPQFVGFLVLIALAFITAFVTLFCAARLGRSTASGIARRTLTLVALPTSVILSAIAFRFLDINAENLWTSWPMLTLFFSAPWALGYVGGLLDRVLPTYDDDPNPLRGDHYAS